MADDIDHVHCQPIGVTHVSLGKVVSFFHFAGSLSSGSVSPKGLFPKLLNPDASAAVVVLNLQRYLSVLRLHPSRSKESQSCCEIVQSGKDSTSVSSFAATESFMKAAVRIHQRDKTQDEGFYLAQTQPEWKTTVVISAASMQTNHLLRLSPSSLKPSVVSSSARLLYHPHTHWRPPLDSKGPDGHTEELIALPICIACLLATFVQAF